MDGLIHPVVAKTDDELLFNFFADEEGKALLRDIVENLHPDDWVVVIARRDVPRLTS